MKLRCDTLLSTSAFKINLRRYNGVRALAPRLRRVYVVRARPILRGKAVQVDPIKPTLKPNGTKRWKLGHEKLLSKFAFKFNLRCYNVGFTVLNYTTQTLFKSVKLVITMLGGWAVNGAA